MSRETWAGEALWEERPTASRSVRVTLEGDRFRAVGLSGGEPAFEVGGRVAQLRRFQQRMEREGARVEGVPALAGGAPPATATDPGAIDGTGTEPPPENPRQPRLLLAHGDDRSPVLPSALDDAAVAAAPALQPGPTLWELWDHGGDVEDLSDQRWGVIVPRGPRGAALLESIQPLVALREKQQGAPARVYEVGPCASEAEVSDWIAGVYTADDVAEEERPRYLLILGDFPDVSVELQQRLGELAFVGRLCAPETAGPDPYAGYRAYAEKVVRFEQAPPRERARALFYTAHDQTDATLVGYRALVLPALEESEREALRRRFPVREVLEVGDPHDWSSSRLLEAARRGGPSVLFTLSHGIGAPRRGWTSREQQRQLAGALSFGPHEPPLTGEQVARGPFLPGGGWFCLACLGAGTPSHSVYRPWVERLKDAGVKAGAVDRLLVQLPAPGEPPFVAALPRAALANPEGPLGIIAHVDLAWTYAFLDARGARRASRFLGVMKEMWAGRRLGVAMSAFGSHAAAVKAEAAGRVQADAEGAPAARLHHGHLWMSYQDLAGYVLLGDPAARVVSPAARPM